MKRSIKKVSGGKKGIKCWTRKASGSQSKSYVTCLPAQKRRRAASRRRVRSKKRARRNRSRR